MINEYNNPNLITCITIIQTLHGDKNFPQNMINYLNDIITQDINHYNSCTIMSNINYIDYNFNNIHPCTTRPLDPKEKTFTKLFQNDIHKLMNMQSMHM
jgi:hypothetical protein